MTLLLATLSPGLLHAGAVFISGSAVTLVGLHVCFLAAASACTALPQRTRMVIPVAAALVLGAWLGRQSRRFCRAEQCKRLR